MQIFPINNNIDFKQLRIIDPDVWRPKRLENFVKNPEVQKLVINAHKNGQDIAAANGILGRIYMYEWTKGKLGRLAYTVKDLKTFSAERAQSHYDKMLKEEETASSDIKKALDYLNNFNKTLREKK